MCWNTSVYTSLHDSHRIFKIFSRDVCIFGRLLLYIDVGDVTHIKDMTMDDLSRMCNDTTHLRVVQLGFPNSCIPTVENVTNWLRKDYGLHIMLIPLGTGKQWWYTIARLGWSRRKEMKTDYDSYEDAQDNAIEHCLNIVENGALSVIF